MSNYTKAGDLLADCGLRPDGSRDYVKVGVAFATDNDERLVLKIDTLPIASKNWQGWINIFPVKIKE